jgi:hypothetical protein
MEIELCMATTTTPPLPHSSLACGVWQPRHAFRHFRQL